MLGTNGLSLLLPFRVASATFVAARAMRMTLFLLFSCATVIFRGHLRSSIVPVQFNDGVLSMNSKRLCRWVGGFDGRVIGHSFMFDRFRLGNVRGILSPVVTTVTTALLVTVLFYWALVVGIATKSIFRGFRDVGERKCQEWASDRSGRVTVYECNTSITATGI